YKKVQELLLENKTQEAERLASLGLFPNPKGEAIYTVAGQLNIQFPKGQTQNYQRTLHLDDGYVSVEYDMDSNHISRRYFASYPNDILGIEILATEAIEIVCQLDREKQIDSIKPEKNGLHLMTRFNKKDECHIRLYVEAEDVQIIGASIIARGKTFHLWISMATTLYRALPTQYTKKILHAALHQGYEEVLHKAKSDYKGLFERQKFSCNDQDMEYMYNLSRYLMISSSRDNLPANLQGLWNQDIYPAWDSKYTININLEMNYWNVFSANLVECFKPVLKLLERMYPNGKRIAKKLYHISGFVAHHNTDIYGDCGLQDHYLPATIWPLGAAWLSQVIFDAYTYQENLSLLKRYGYILEDAARFILNLGIEDQEGYFVLCPSLSPENSYM
ncbi:MAG: glycoside hydrolase family 95 protein, partial [Anaeroplasmataceae bacterium]|nr:glycoside hydrolase family 95 protein [Anaeroplasmataceae bacterium]